MEETESISSLQNVNIQPTRPQQNIQSSVAASKPRNSSRSMNECFTAFFIPGFPKTIGEVVYLWKYEPRDKMFKPVELFEKAED